MAPGPSGAEVVEVCWAVDDTTTWDCAEDSTGCLLEGELSVIFAPWEVGLHTLFLRARDESGDSSLLEGRFRMFAGPRFAPEPDRYILVVLDTEPTDLIAQGILPADYEQLELDRVGDWLDGYDIQIHQTHGTEAPPLSLLDGASSLVWLHSADPAQGTASVLAGYHQDWPTEPPLAGYAWSGGNLLLCRSGSPRGRVP